MSDGGSELDHVLAWDETDEEQVENEIDPDALTGEGLDEENGDVERFELEGEVEDGPAADNRPQARPLVVIRGMIVNKYRAPVAGAAVQLAFNRSGRRGRGRRGQVRIPKPVVTGREDELNRSNHSCLSHQSLFLFSCQNYLMITKILLA